MQTKEELAAYLLRLVDAQSSFLDFVRLMRPEWKVIPDFHLRLIDTLDRLERGELVNEAGEPVRNLLVTMAPRFSKSQICTVTFPAYYMGRKPWRNTMSCSYNTELATGFGRDVRSLVEQNLMSQIFPDFKLSREYRAATEWRTEVDGELGGKYFAVGIGGTTSGRPANLLILDDPIRAREDAESMLQRNKTWKYYTSALTARMEPTLDNDPPIQIVILTRWHPDDIAGRLMESEDWKEGKWHHIDFPAYSEVEEYEADPEKPGSKIVVKRKVPLWPERFPLEVLLAKERLDPHEFASLYLQRPTVEGGNLIKQNWWRFYNVKEFRESPPPFQLKIIAADTAFKKNQDNDYSVIMLLGLTVYGDIYILDVYRNKLEFPDLKRALVLENVKHRGQGLRGIYIEDKASGQSLIQELKRQSGMSVIPYRVVTDKRARVNAVLPLIEGGRVFLPDEAPWLDDFMNELQSFPVGKHDDQVDAMTIGLDALSHIAVSGEYIEAVSLSSGPSLTDMMSGKFKTHANDADVRHQGPGGMGRSLNSLMTGNVKVPASWKGWGL